MIETVKKTFMLLSAIAFMASCDDKQPQDAGDGGSWGSGIAEGYEKVEILYDRNVILRNPMSGWVIYVPLIEDVDKFWENYDNFPYNKSLDPFDVSSEQTVSVFDFGNVLYLRGSWTDFNPEEGVYIWQDGVDTPQARSLRALEEGAAERDLKVAITLKVDSRDANAFCTPDFVRQKMDAAYGLQAGGTEADPASGRGYFKFTLGSVGHEREYWSPYPDDPIFQEEYAKFINALAEEYNDPERTMFVSGLGLGKWGEYHTCIYSTGDESPREAVFDWVTNVYSKAFTKVPVVTNFHKFVGCTISEGTAQSEPERCALSEKMLANAISKGFCMRHDAFGMRADTFGYASWEKTFISKYIYQIPVIGEGGWIVTQGGHDENGNPKNYLTQYSDARALREGEYEDMSSAYVNMMDLRFDESYVRGETWSWFNDAYDLVLEFLREGCYRVYPYQVTVPVKMVNGQEYTIDHGWKNRGKAYCPTNIPQYQDRFKVAFALLNTETGEIVGDNIFFDETADPSEWTEDGGPVGYSLKVTPENVPAGYYNIGVAIIDMFAGDPATGDYRPGIQLSAQNETTATGWLKVKKIAVTDK